MSARGVGQNSAMALAGDLAAKGGTLAVMAVAARGLETSQFAALATAFATATVLAAALDLGSQTLLTRDGVAGASARGGLLLALVLARIPLLVATLTVAAAIGVASGRPLYALCTVAIAAAGAAQLSLSGALRSAQDLRPEALAKLATGILQFIAAAACAALAPSAPAMLLALAGAILLGAVPMVRSARRVLRRGPAPSPWKALRKAAPLGAVALATLAYYRSGTIALSVLSSPAQTARFATASTVAWGLLAVGNAVTTGLLPRLSAARSATERDAVLRRALVWLTALSVLLAATVALLARPLLVVGFGARYADAAGTLALLALSTAVIAPAGVLGTALIAAGRLRPLAIQVGASLTANLLALALLVPRLGAGGAAIATVACELVGLALLVRATAPALSDVAPRSALATKGGG